MRTTEKVPAVAEAIDRRRRECGYPTIDALAAAAGISRQGLRPVLYGQRGNYSDKTRLGIARALNWPVDAIERLFAGENPAAFPTVDYESEDTSLDQRLTRIEDQLAEMIRVLGQLTATTQGARGTPENGGRQGR